MKRELSHKEVASQLLARYTPAGGFASIKMEEPAVISGRTSANKVITVRITNNYGNKTIYPVCIDACVFTELARQKTLTDRDIALIKTLGYRVLVQPAATAEL